jgi:hypothetical protein
MRTNRQKREFRGIFPAFERLSAQLFRQIARRAAGLSARFIKKIPSVRCNITSHRRQNRQNRIGGAGQSPSPRAVKGQGFPQSQLPQLRNHGYYSPIQIKTTQTPNFFILRTMVD